MVNLPSKSLRVVYELILSVSDFDVNAALAAMASHEFNVDNASAIKWYAAVHTYMTIPETNQHRLLHSHTMPVDRVEAHYRETIRITQDIQSLVVYANPVTGERHQMGGDWVHGPLNAADAAAKRRAEERFTVC